MYCFDGTTAQRKHYIVRALVRSFATYVYVELEMVGCVLFFLSLRRNGNYFHSDRSEWCFRAHFRRKEAPTRTISNSRRSASQKRPRRCRGKHRIAWPPLTLKHVVSFNRNRVCAPFFRVRSRSFSLLCLSVKPLSLSVLSSPFPSTICFHNF